MTGLLSPHLAAQHIARGQVVAYPTEAVYGLGCDPQNLSAVQAVLELKARDAHKGFIVIAASVDQLTNYMQPPNASELERLNAAWPGPVTFIVKAKIDLPNLLTGGRDTIAVRVSSHPVVVSLCNACGHALISTSANLSGQPALTTPVEVQNIFGESLAGVVEGELGNLKSATPIFSLSTGEQLR